MDNLIYHLRRSFSKGDQNYDAQFWYARYCFASNSEELIEEGKQIFRDLRDAPIPHDVRHEIRSKVEEGNAPKSFTGTLTRKEVTYGFIERDGRGDRVFTHRNDLDAEIWRLLQENDRVNFEIGFNFGGPIALNVEPWLNEV